jgi:hypothetical protein
MEFNIQENGNLQIVAEPSDIPELTEMLERTPHKDHGFLADLLEHTGWTPNGRLYQVFPEQIGALTDAPILSDNVEHLDAGQVNVRGKVWWFPAYEIRSFAEDLIANGEVIFTAAPD